MKLIVIFCIIAFVNCNTKKGPVSEKDDTNASIKNIIKEFDEAKIDSGIYFDRNLKKELKWVRLTIGKNEFFSVYDNKTGEYFHGFSSEKGSTETKSFKKPNHEDGIFGPPSRPDLK
jgi:hypothetical protein